MIKAPLVKVEQDASGERWVPASASSQDMKLIYSKLILHPVHTARSLQLSWNPNPMGLQHNAQQQKATGSPEHLRNSHTSTSGIDFTS